MSTSSLTREPVVAIVVAAGSGTRLGGDVPKALVEIAGRSLVARSVDALAAGGCSAAVVVVAEGLEDAFRAALAQVPVDVRFVLGGARRQDSVRHGLDAIALDPSLASARTVLVHDAARAFVPPEVVARVIDAVHQGAPAAVPVVPVTDTVRQLTQVGSAIIDRSELRAVQTPQGFDRVALVEAHALVHEHNAEITDDAAAIEYDGGTVTLVEGSREAFKITDPFDLVLARALASQR